MAFQGFRTAYAPLLRNGNDCNIIARRNQLISPLLSLPAELRNRIYEYTFANVIVSVRFMNIPWRSRNGPLSLLYVSRQINYEAFQVFLTRCTFDARHIWYKDSLLKVMEARNLDLITSLLVSPNAMRALIADMGKRDGESLRSLRHLEVQDYSIKKQDQVVLLAEIRQSLPREDLIVTFRSYR